jgi:DNA-binding XRE family transcriptional regulator
MFHEELAKSLQTHNKTEMASYVEVSRTTIYLWKNGKREPSVPNLVRLCQFMYGDSWQTAFIRWSIMLTYPSNVL